MGGVISIFGNVFSGDGLLNDKQMMWGKVLGGVIGCFGGAIGANLLGDVIPGLKSDMAFYGTVGLGGLLGYTMLGGGIGLASTILTF